MLANEDPERFELCSGLAHSIIVRKISHCLNNFFLLNFCGSMITYKVLKIPDKDSKVLIVMVPRKWKKKSNLQ